MTILYIIFSIVATFIFFRLILAIMTTITINEAKLVDGYAYSERAELILELESICSLKARRQYYAGMHMDLPVEFDEGDFGPEGGVQIREAVGRQMSERTFDDRIKRFPGECNPAKAWPLSKDLTENTLEEQFDKCTVLVERMRRNLLSLAKKASGGKRNQGLPTLSECESGVSGSSQSQSMEQAN